MCYDIENAGVEENKFGIATTNYTPQDSQMAAVIQWSKIHEDALADNSREGCTCIIFWSFSFIYIDRIKETIYFYSIICIFDPITTYS